MVDEIFLAKLKIVYDPHRDNHKFAIFHAGLLMLCVAALNFVNFIYVFRITFFKVAQYNPAVSPDTRLHMETGGFPPTLVSS